MFSSSFVRVYGQRASWFDEGIHSMPFPTKPAAVALILAMSFHHSRRRRSSSRALFAGAE
jgi:hypothetical protein